MPLLGQPIVAAVTPHRAGGADDLVSGIAFSLMSNGWRVRGLAQERFRRHGRSQYSLIDLENSQPYIINQDQGRYSDSCSLDPRAMAEASVVLRRIAEEGADLAFVNRFGKQEADGKGFSSEMLDIMSRGIPLLTIVQDEYLSAWREFTGGMAIELDSNQEQIEAWLLSAAGSSRGQKIPFISEDSDKTNCFHADRQQISQNQKQTVRDGALANMRHAKGILQQELADRMDVSQAHIANLEQKQDMLLSTLRRYVQSLGGELDLVARFPGVSYHLGRNT